MLVGEKRLADLLEEAANLGGLPVSREAQVLDFSPDDLPPAEELREDVQGALNGWVTLARRVLADVPLNELKLKNVVSLARSS